MKTSWWLRRVRLLATLALACCAVAAVTAGPAAAAGKKPAKQGKAENVAGRLDPSFGLDGALAIDFPAENGGEVGIRYALPFSFTPGHLEMAAAPGGKIVVAGASQVVRILPNAKPDHSFGNGSVVATPRIPGANFVFSSVAVDSQGRILLAGSARPQPVSSAPDPLASSAVVIRLNSDGSLDTSFGHNGGIVTNFGVEPPKIGPTTYTAPSVGLRDIAVDSEDRPIVSGGYVEAITGCGQSAQSTAFVARLTEAGTLDGSFGEGGLRRIDDLGSFGQLALTEGGGLIALGDAARRCEGRGGGPPEVLTGFGESGNLDPGFGTSGFRVVGYQTAPAITVAPSGKIVLLGTKSRRRRTQLLTQLLPSGATDPSFSRGGRDYIVLAKGYPKAFAAVAVDRKGRILLAGRAAKRVSKKSNNRLLRSSFLVARFTPSGRFDHSFGVDGEVATGFGGPANAFATQVMLDPQGRILVGGGITSPQLNTGGGFAIARYLSGN